MHQWIDLKKDHTILWDKVSQYIDIKLHTDRYNHITNICYGNCAVNRLLPWLIQFIFDGTCNKSATITSRIYLERFIIKQRKRKARAVSVASLLHYMRFSKWLGKIPEIHVQKATNPLVSAQRLDIKQTFTDSTKVFCKSCKCPISFITNLLWLIKKNMRQSQQVQNVFLTSQFDCS